jgi:murein DD-endopeptidase MepM/ murein hydrolase activator NlpD
MNTIAASTGLLIALTALAAAEPHVTVSATSVHPGEPVLVTITNSDQMPRGKAGGQPLVFFHARDGYQAVFAIPLGINEDHVLIEIAGAPDPVSLAVANKRFPETKVVVEDEYANPAEAERTRIDADNRAISASYDKAAGELQFGRGFRRPPGRTTSTFGEWRTFNDGHRAQHLGLDLAAREGARVVAINDGTVALVIDTFLAGNVVVVAHGGGISSLYFHLSRATVREGDAVKRSQEIGRAGHTGRTTGPHVHLSVHVPGGMADPGAFMKLRIAPPKPAVVGAR